MDENDPKVFIDELYKEKEIIEKYIKQLEKSIIDNETKYLQDTINCGNILRGWDFTKTNKNHIGNQNKKPHISSNEKLFSQTFNFDENSLEDIIKNSEKNIINNTSNNIKNNINNNIKIEENKNIEENNNINNSNKNIKKDNYKKNKTKIKSLGKKRKRNNNNDNNSNNKPENQKNS